MMYSGVIERLTGIAGFAAAPRSKGGGGGSRDEGSILGGLGSVIGGRGGDDD